MNLYTQSDHRWMNDIMTESADVPEDTRNKFVDTLGRWGCLVTALTNIHNIFHNNYEKTPADANKLIRKLLGYKFLIDGTKCPIDQESFLTENGIKTAFGIDEIIYKFDGDIKIEDKYYYYLIRCPFDKKNKIYSGHYNFVYNKTENGLVHFDSNSGKFRYDYEKCNYNLYWINRVHFNYNSLLLKRG